MMRRKFLVAKSMMEPKTHERLGELFRLINHRDSFSNSELLEKQFQEVVALLNGKNRVRDYAEPIFSAAWHHPQNKHVAFLFGRVVREAPQSISLESVIRLLYSGYTEDIRDINLGRVNRVGHARPDLAAHIVYDVVAGFKIGSQKAKDLFNFMVGRLPDSFTIREVGSLLADVGSPLRGNSLARQRELLDAVKDIASAHPILAQRTSTSLVAILNNLHERILHTPKSTTLLDRRDHRQDAASAKALLPFVKEAHDAVRRVAQEYAARPKTRTPSRVLRARKAGTPRKTQRQLNLL